MAEQNKKIEIKKPIEKETKDKIVDEKKAIPEKGLQDKIQGKHKKLTAETTKAYIPQNVIKVEEEARLIYLAQKTKTKHIRTTTYKNGVVKNKLVGLTKGTGADKVVIFDKGIKK